MAAAVRTDPDHARCVELFEQSQDSFLVPQLVIAEAAYLIGRIAGAQTEAAFIRLLPEAPLTLVPFEPEDLRRMADLMETYADLPLGAVDAAVVAIAERQAVSTIATLDRRHFSVVRPAHVSHLTLLP